MLLVEYARPARAAAARRAAAVAIVASRAAGVARLDQISDESERRGGMAAWRHGGMAAWRHGGMAAWRHGGMAAIWKVRIARVHGCGTMKLWCDVAQAS
ncbi:hypothetical protein [Burkholderia vietnamiensis]|uniref:hypothetical protein n=1 Tax=Burkholderia vietnamiensis TaxID=60552 RepID=UPI00265690D2|nr:hypothetical protein [Burkholderia vietnamiensis]MDN8035184.1 hypothetical protein [Burkholderia vietnamiensis]